MPPLVAGGALEAPDEAEPVAEPPPLLAPLLLDVPDELDDGLPTAAELAGAGVFALVSPC
ncbi:MAG: hypothetical protein M3Z00_00665 [Actinomycetota bacterium]|nr:hypothetical protein [Actinomycetota bacterium]